MMVNILLRKFLVVLLVLTLSACSGNDNEQQGDATVSISADVAQAFVGRSATVNDLPFDNGGSLKAKVFIGDGVGQQANIVSNSKLRFTADDVGVDTHSISIDFIFDSPDFGNDITFASATKTVDVSVGLNVIDFSDARFQTDKYRNGENVPYIDVLTDRSAPLATIVFPPPSSATDGDFVMVRVQAEDTLGDIASVSVNGISALQEDTSNWYAEVPLAMGENALSAVAVDRSGNQSSAQATAKIHRYAERTFLATPAGAVVDEQSNKLYFVDEALFNVIEQDLATGRTRSLVQAPADQDVLLFRSQELVLDKARRRLLIIGWFGMTALSLDTGQLSEFSDFSDKSVDDPTLNYLGMSIDTKKDRVLAVDRKDDSVYAFQLSDGTRRLISNNTTPNDETPFQNPIDIVYDAQNDRAFVLDTQAVDGEAAIITVNLETGERDVFSSNILPDASNTFSNPRAFALDRENNRLLVTDTGRKAVLTVNLETGGRGILSDTNTPEDSQFKFRHPNGIAVDSTGQRALVTDSLLNAVVAVDLDSGARTVLRDEQSPAPNSFLFGSRYVSMDQRNNRLLVSSSETRSIVAVDMNSGLRSPFSQTDRFTQALFGLGGLHVDPNNNRALVADGGRLVEMDTNTGTYSEVWKSGVPGLLGTDVALDSENNRAFIVYRNEIREINLNTAESFILTDNTTPDAGDTFGWLRFAALDISNNRLIATDSRKLVVIGVDLDTGARTRLSTATFPDPLGVAINSTGTQALVTGRSALTALDLTVDSPVARTFVSSTKVPNARNIMGFARGLVVDELERAWIIDEDRNAIVVLDLTNGERVLLPNVTQ